MGELLISKIKRGYILLIGLSINRTCCLFLISILMFVANWIFYKSNTRVERPIFFS